MATSEATQGEPVKLAYEVPTIVARVEVAARLIPPTIVS
jgi:hypothetical protein